MWADRLPVATSPTAEPATPATSRKALAVPRISVGNISPLKAPSAGVAIPPRKMNVADDTQSTTLP